MLTSSKPLLFSKKPMNEVAQEQNDGLENNRVVVRIWTSGFSGGENVGHVSVDIPAIPNAYFSLWPMGLPNGKIQQFYEIREHDFFTLAGDVHAEGRQAEKTICLYTLNAEEIQAKFNFFKANLSGWTLLGSNLLLNNCSAESCASLALKLLQAGGLNEGNSSLSISVTPDIMAAVLAEAKMNELKTHPFTAELIFEGETTIKDLYTDNKKAQCIIL